MKIAELYKDYEVCPMQEINLMNCAFQGLEAIHKTRMRLYEQDQLTDGPLTLVVTPELRESTERRYKVRYDQLTERTKQLIAMVPNGCTCKYTKEEDNDKSSCQIAPMTEIQKAVRERFPVC